MIGQPLSSAYICEYPHGEDEQSILSAIRQNGRWSGDSLHILGDGRRLLVECEVSSLRDDAGVENGWIAVVRDVTAKRQKELDIIDNEKRARDQAQEQWEKLRGNSDVLEHFLENLPACAYVKDESGRHLFSNRSARESVLKLSESRGKTDEELFGPKLGKQLRDTNVAMLNSNQPIRTIEVLGTEEEPRSFLSVKFPILDANGRRFIGGVSIEVTETILAQQQLREQAALLDGANDGIFVTSLDGNITYWNKGAERLYG